MIRNRRARQHVIGALTVSVLLLCIAFTSMIVIIPERAEAAYTDFTYYKLITVDRTKVEGIHTNMVLWVYNTSSDFADNCLSNGNDIAFFSYDNNTQYKHDIEVWNSATGEIGAWVNVSDAITDAADFKFWVYYGNGSVSDQRDMDGTWDSKYLAVYHFNVSTGVNLYDSSGNGHYLIANNTPTSTANGKFGKAMVFDGVNDWYINHTGDDASFNMGAGSFTIFAWVMADSDAYTDSRRILEKGIGGAGNKRYDLLGYHIQPYLYNISVTFDDDTVNEVELTSMINLSANSTTWYSFTIIRNETSNIHSLFINDTLNSTTQADLGNIDQAGSGFVIGAQSSKAPPLWNPGISPWKGKIDEVWVMKGNAVSWAYRNTTYNNQRDVEAFLTFGPQQGVSIYEIKGLEGTDKNVTWSGISGETVWSNATDGAGGTMEISMSIIEADNVTELRINLTHLDVSEGIYNSNISLQVSRDNVSWGINVTQYSGANFTINSTLWTEANGFYGSNPFAGAGLTDTVASIFVRFRLAIPGGASSGLYSKSDWKVYVGHYA